MSQFARRLGYTALSLVCVITLGWPRGVRTSLYRSLYPLSALDQAVLAAPPSSLTPLGYIVDDPVELRVFRDAAAPVVAGVADEPMRLRKITDLIYRYHPGSATFPPIPGGRERGVHAIFAEIQSGKFALCGQKTIVLAALWRSLGGDVRQIRFSKGDNAVAWYAGHYGIEVYSVRWRKWFYYDATLNGFAASPAGEPLSLIEINRHLANGDDVEMVASAEHFDWDTNTLLQSIRTNRLQVYSLDNRLREQDPDRRFGPLNFGYAWFSKLPRPLDGVLDAITGDAARRFVARPSAPPPAATARMHLTAGPIGQGPSP